MNSKFKPSVQKPESTSDLYWVQAPGANQVQTTHAGFIFGWVTEELLWTVPAHWLILTEAEYEGRRPHPCPPRLFRYLSKQGSLRAQHDELLTERLHLLRKADRLWDDLVNALGRENAWVRDALSFRASHEYTEPGQRSQNGLYQSILEHFKADPRLADVQERSRHLLGQAEALDAELAVVEMGLNAVQVLFTREK